MSLRSPTLILVALTLSGCVTGRRTFDLPVTTSATPSQTRGSVYIASVTDDRQFQNKPSDPSVPSINGDVTKSSSGQRDQMIGRQRNTWGKAMGDVSLPEHDSVTQRVRLLVQQGLLRGGFRVSTDPSTPTSVAVSIQDFWGWMTPGFATLTFEAKIACTLVASGPAGRQTIVVKGSGLNHGQVAKDENWIEAFEPAFEDFMSNLSAESRDLQPGSAASAGAP